MVTVQGKAVVGGVQFNPTDNLTITSSGNPGAVQLFAKGRLVTATNVGLPGRGLTNSNLAVVTGNPTTSSLGAVVTRKWFKGTPVINSNITYVECRFDNPIVNTTNFLVKVFDSNVEPSTPGDFAIGHSNFWAYRCILNGNSDGLRTNGGVVATNCYIRVKDQSSSDHNDGVQNYNGNGSVDIIANNIDITGGTGQNAALFSADNAQGATKWHDNYLVGGGYTVRPHENCVFSIQGNEILNNSWQYGPWNDANMNPASQVGNIRPNVIVNASGAVVSTL